MRVLRAGSMMQLLRGKRSPRCRRRTATCPPSRPGPATSIHTLPVPGQQEGDATVFTKGKRKEAEQLSTSSSTPTKLSEPRTAETSPLVYARVAGFLLLFIVVIAPFSQLYVPSTLIVPGDATATANNIGASGWVLRLGIVSDSLVFLIEIVLCVLLYVLFRPVSRTLSLVAAFARLAMTIVMGINLLAYFTALLLLSGAAYLTVFGPAQLDALALLSLNAHQYGVYIWEAFFGLDLAVLGYLIFKSGYFPRILGVLIVLRKKGGRYGLSETAEPYC